MTWRTLSKSKGFEIEAIAPASRHCLIMNWLLVAVMSMIRASGLNSMISLTTVNPSFFGIARSNNKRSGWISLNFSTASLPSIASPANSCLPIDTISCKTWRIASESSATRTFAIIRWNVCYLRERLVQIFRIFGFHLLF